MVDYSERAEMDGDDSTTSPKTNTSKLRPTTTVELLVCTRSQANGLAGLATGVDLDSESGELYVGEPCNLS